MARRKQIIFLIIATFLGFFAFRKAPPRPFSEKEISSSLAPSPQWTIPAPNNEVRRELESLFSTPLTFLGEGAQAYAFASNDGKYVVKFFKMRRFTPSLSDMMCPHVVRRRLRNLHWVFNGYKIAYDHFRKDTGLLFIHLAKTGDLHQTATLIDTLGKKYLIDLDQTEFVIQERAQPIFSYLETLYREGKVREAESSIAAVLELVKNRTTQGYADRDKGVSNNYGFAQGRPIHLDVGRLYKGSKPGQVEHVEKRIQRWKEEKLDSKA